MVARLSGALVVDQREWLKSLLGEEGYRAALDAVPPDVREAYEGALMLSWVPTTVVDEVITAAARRVGKRPLEFHAELTRLNMERTLRGLWRVLLRFTGDVALVQRTPLIYRKTFDTGDLEGTIPEPGHSVVTLRGWPEISDIHLVGLQTGIETVLRVAGRQDVHGTSRRTADGAVIEVRWHR
ncbi:MAG: hypothetical protein ACODAU_04810 [Myxococcota bacterium]